MATISPSYLNTPLIADEPESGAQPAEQSGKPVALGQGAAPRTDSVQLSEQAKAAGQASAQTEEVAELATEGGVSPFMKVIQDYGLDKIENCADGFFKAMLRRIKESEAATQETLAREAEYAETRAAHAEEAEAANPAGSDAADTVSNIFSEQELLPKNTAASKYMGASTKLFKQTAVNFSRHY